ncbi:hypothetical protein [Microbacterium profundi]
MGVGRIFKEAFESVLNAATHSKRLQGLTDNLGLHIGGFGKKVKKNDTFDGNDKGVDYSTKAHKPGSGESSGPVVFYDPKKGATPDQKAQIQEYIDGCNAAGKDGYLSPTGRVSTKGELRTDASAAAAAEKAGGTYTGHPGHVPDTTWTGIPDPHSWLDLDPSVNTSLGSQALRYPVGYRPKNFIYGGEYPT